MPDAILEIRYYGTYNFVGTRIDGYEEPTALLTKQAAAALKEVSDDVMAQGSQSVRHSVRLGIKTRDNEQEYSTKRLAASAGLTPAGHR